MNSWPDKGYPKKICKKINIQVLNDKVAVASTLNLGAIWKSHAWQHF
jgi:hypothetical protein